ncbi:MAG TPA: serine protease [Thermoanaerobaculia bacterium]|nr:serine protease [Thermoanaerobaculia bacterium]
MAPEPTEGGFLERLAEAVERFDREGAERLCNELIGRLERGDLPGVRTAKAILNTLRRKCYFDLMERVANACRLAGMEEHQIRRQYAQSLIDQGKIDAAVDVLELLVARTAEDSDENAEARGLLGRVFKQLYVNALLEDPDARGLRLVQLHLQRAVRYYHEVYRQDPQGRLWHGINTVALTLRAERDGVELAPGADGRAIAREILAIIEARKQAGSVDYWDLATAAEASVALGDSQQALVWTAEYVQHPGVDAFELSSTERQLREVWGLTVAEPPGSLLLPLLQSQILQHKGGRVQLAGGTLGETIRTTEHGAKSPTMEKILGAAGVVTLKWYLDGLERCRNVAQVVTETEEAVGTGFLVRGGDLAPDLGEEIVLLTNAHVVSEDPEVRKAEGALAPEEAVVRFEALEAAAGETFRVSELLWTSPPHALDATLLRLEPPIEAVGSYPLTERLPLADGKQKVYVIGHPGGRTLSLSLHDNLLLDHDDRMIHYRAPTEGGSSGSPVFNQQWKLIGLHHAGSLEMPRLKGQPGTYPANEGVWIQRIVQAVRSELRP